MNQSWKTFPTHKRHPSRVTDFPSVRTVDPVDGRHLAKVILIQGGSRDLEMSLRHHLNDHLFIIWRCTLRKNIKLTKFRRIKSIYFLTMQISHRVLLNIFEPEYKSSDRVSASVRWIESFTQGAKSQYTDISSTHVILSIEKRKKAAAYFVCRRDASRCGPRTHVFRTSVPQRRLRVELQP